MRCGPASTCSPPTLLQGDCGYEARCRVVSQDVVPCQMQRRRCQMSAGASGNASSNFLRVNSVQKSSGGASKPAMRRSFRPCVRATARAGLTLEEEGRI